MEFEKVVISGVSKEEKAKLCGLVEQLKAMNDSHLPLKFDNSVLLRAALRDFFSAYGDDPKKLLQRLSNDKKREAT